VDERIDAAEDADLYGQLPLFPERPYTLAVARSTVGQLTSSSVGAPDRDLTYSAAAFAAPGSDAAFAVGAIQAAMAITTRERSENRLPNSFSRLWPTLTGDAFVGSLTVCDLVSYRL
jgi:hypothetical protein